MDTANNNLAINPLPAGKRVAFLQACWHRDITDRGRLAFTKEMATLGVAESQIDFIELPGVFEIPLHAKLLAATGQYAAIVGCGFIVNGGIYRHEFVSTAVIDGIMRVQLDTGVPVISCILTPQNFHEHEEHLRFFKEHFLVKGAEAARACVKTVQAIAQLQARLPALKAA